MEWTFRTLGLMAALVAAAAAPAQVRWEKTASNPVMVRSGSFFEALAIGQPAVLEENGTLRMWYAAGGLDHRGRIMAARSTDGGVSWERENGGWPVLDVGPPGAWDSFFLDTPEVILDDGDYRLYYYGSTSNDSVGAAIGLAISSDGIHFERAGDGPVLKPGPPGSWDELWVESPAVVRLPETGRYLMLYTGIDGSWRVRVGLATSEDGERWVKHPDNPVLDVGPPGSWEDGWLGVPGLIRWRGGLLMIYSAVSQEDLADGTPDDIGVGVATSADGVHWRRFGGNPVLTTHTPTYDPGVDDRGPWAPDLVWDPSTGRFVMLYETATGFCRATAPRETLRRPAGRASRGRQGRTASPTALYHAHTRNGPAGGAAGGSAQRFTGHAPPRALRSGIAPSGESCAECGCGFSRAAGRSSPRRPAATAGRSRTMGRGGRCARGARSRRRGGSSLSPAPRAPRTGGRISPPDTPRRHASGALQGFPGRVFSAKVSPRRRSRRKRAVEDEHEQTDRGGDARGRDRQGGAARGAEGAGRGGLRGRLRGGGDRLGTLGPGG